MLKRYKCYLLLFYRNELLMEVHHHGHVHHQRKWKEYLFQFLMLFIAVFCGFLAEYKLEHFIEKERAKELGITLYEELKSDSSNLDQVIHNRQEKVAHLRYIYNYIKDSTLQKLPRDFYPHFVWSFFAVSYIQFEPKDGMLEQLKISGSLRYFRNVELQKAVGDFSVAVNNLRTRLERETTVTATINRDFTLNHIDLDWVDKLTGNGEASVYNSLKKYEKEDQVLQASILNLSALNKAATCNLILYNLQLLTSTRNNQMAQYQQASSRLMKLLRAKYDLQ